jgi:STE24 endopeptidase
MYIALVFAVVVTLTLAEGAPADPVPHSAARCFFAVAAMAVVVGLAAVLTWGTVRALRHDFSQRRQYLRDFERWQQIHTGLWLGVVLAIQYGLAWPRLVLTNWRLGHIALADDALVLVPVVVPLLLTWAVHFDVERAVCVRGLPEPWRLRWTDRGTYVAGYARHYFAVTLVPVLALLGTRDAVRTWFPEVLDRRHAGLIYLAPVAAMVIGFPWLLRAVWRTERLADSPLRNRLIRTARRCNVRLRDIRIWKTDGRVVNAALAGLVPPVRFVFLSDGLLQLLDDDEIEAVFLHEAGHARLHHAAQRIMAVAIPFVFWQAVEGWLPAPGTGTPIANPPLAGWRQPIWPLVSVMTVGALVVVTLGWYSRLLERQADLWACGQGRDSQSAPGKAEDIVTVYTRALEKISLAHRADRHRADWLHPSLQSRINFLRHTIAAPSRATVFHRQLGRARTVLLATAAAAVVLLAAAG